MPCPARSLLAPAPIIYPMRRILHLALMLLLVLRGLMGTAMAADFVPERPAQLAHAPTMTHHASPSMEADQGAVVDSAAEAACHTAAGDGCAAHEHSPACSACDICHSALLAPMALAAPLVPTSSAARPTATAAFASAQAALAIKPPIL